MSSLSGKRVVIFGCGYVGAAVARWALENKLHVTALTRNTAAAVLLREIGVEAVVADLASETWHTEIEGGADFAVDCVSSGGGGTDAYRRSYVDGMHSILAWARRRGPVGTLVYTSSTSVYPQGDGVDVNEMSPTAAMSERVELLLETERLLRENDGAAQRWFVLRLTGIYGPGRHHLLEQVRAGEVSGFGEHRLNLAHRDDIAAAIAACFTASSVVVSNVFNIADDAPAKKSEVVAWLADKLGVPPPHFTGEPAGGRRSVTPDRVIVAAKAKSRLGWRPRYPTFREGYANLLSR